MTITFLGDVDGVFCNFIAGASANAKRLFGIDTTHDQVKFWNFERSFNLTPEQVTALIASWRDPGFCAELPPYPGAVEAAAEIKQHARFIAVTHAFDSVTWVSERDEWLRRHLGLRPGKDIIHTEAKDVIKGDVFVDDKVEQVVAWQKAHPQGVGILWAQPYNVDAVRDVNGFGPQWDGLRTNDWSEVIGIVKAMRWIRRPVS